MEEADPETVLAYYLYAQHGWPPSKFLALPTRERVLVAKFAVREAEQHKKMMERR